MIQDKAMITKLERDLQQLSNSLPTHQEFVELANSYLETILSTTDIIEEDMICNKLVLNLRAGDNAVSVIKLNLPYNLMVDLEKIPFGWTILDLIRNPKNYDDLFKNFNFELAELILKKYNLLPRTATA